MLWNIQNLRYQAKQEEEGDGSGGEEAARSDWPDTNDEEEEEEELAPVKRARGRQMLVEGACFAFLVFARPPLSGDIAASNQPDGNLPEYRAACCGVPDDG